MIIMKIPYRRLWLLGEWECRVLLITSAASNDSAKEDGKSLTFDPPSRESGKHHCSSQRSLAAKLITGAENEFIFIGRR